MDNASPAWRFIASVFVAQLLLVACAIAQSPTNDELSGRLQRIMQRLDRDNDGAISEAEFKKWQQRGVAKPIAFADVDGDGDGSIRAAELEQFAWQRKLENAGGDTIDAADMPALPPHTKHLNVPYAKADESPQRLQCLDIYAPQAAAKAPVMVMIHGGGWRAGDKSSAGVTSAKMRHFVANGFIFVSINYRLSPAVQHPVHVQDVAAALAWISDHIAEYGGDPQRLFVMGHSAGAHLAALVATDESYLKPHGRTLELIKGVILLDSAAYDLPRLIDELRGGQAMRRMYENAFGTDREVWRDASPTFHVARGKHIPPFLVFHAGQRPASATLAREFAAALKDAGVAAEVVHAADKDHAAINREIGTKDNEPTRHIMAFLKRCGVSPVRPQTMP